MSGVETGATGNLREDAPVPQGTYQGGYRGYHHFPAADWPASGQRQCIAGWATQQQQQRTDGARLQTGLAVVRVEVAEASLVTTSTVTDVRAIGVLTRSSVATSRIQ